MSRTRRSLTAAPVSWIGGALVLLALGLLLTGGVLGLMLNSGAPPSAGLLRVQGFLIELGLGGTWRPACWGLVGALGAFVAVRGRTLTLGEYLARAPEPLGVSSRGRKLATAAALAAAAGVAVFSGGAGLLVLLSWGLVFLVFTGLGAGVLRLLRLRAPDPCASSFWLGWVTLIGALQLWNLWLPVNGAAFLLLGALGVAGLVWERKRVTRRLRSSLCRRSLPVLLLLLLAAVLLANRALGEVRNFDSGLYHLSMIGWLNSYPVVPGLGNLEIRLAYNQSYFLYPAWLESGPWAGKSHHIANSLLFLVLFGQLSWALRRVARRGGDAQPSELLAAVLLGPTCAHVVGTELTSPSSDEVVFALGAVVLVTLSRCLERRRTAGSELLLFALAAALILVKLSGVTLGAAACVVILVRALPRAGGHRRRVLGWALGIALLLGTPWVVRGVVTSGYVAFPIGLLPAPVDWRMPREELDALRRLIADWPKVADPKTLPLAEGSDWFAGWVGRSLTHKAWVTLPLLVTLLAGAVRLIAPHQAERRCGAASWLFLPPALGLALWFVAGPNVRFLGVLLWGFAAVALATTLRRGPRVSGEPLSVALLITALLTLALSDSREPLLVRPHPSEGFHPTRTHGPLQTYVTPSGLKLYLPAPDDQLRTWHAPLPVSLSPNARLRLREPGNLGAGFCLGPP